MQGKGVVIQRRIRQRQLLICTVLVIGAATLGGCAAMAVDTTSLLAPRFQRSEVVGLLAGLGTTFAAAPDLIKMLRRRSAAGMNPMMAGLMGAFQIVWVYYGLLIASRPLIAWNAIGVLVNFFSVAAMSASPGSSVAEPDA